MFCSEPDHQAPQRIPGKSYRLFSVQSGVDSEREIAFDHVGDRRRTRNLQQMKCRSLGRLGAFARGHLDLANVEQQCVRGMRLGEVLSLKPRRRGAVDVPAGLVCEQVTPQHDEVVAGRESAHRRTQFE